MFSTFSQKLQNEMCDYINPSMIKLAAQHRNETVKYKMTRFLSNCRFFCAQVTDNLPILI